jgi:hypothetical protein
VLRPHVLGKYPNTYKRIRLVAFRVNQPDRPLRHIVAGLVQLVVLILVEAEKEQSLQYLSRLVVGFPVANKDRVAEVDKLYI